MTDNVIDTVVDRYLAVWNEQDEQTRRELAERTFTDNATYVDPIGAASGISDLVATIGAVQQQFPGATFTVGRSADTHHDVVRFGWNLGTPDAPDIVVGFDVATVTESGRISAVIGFLDKVPRG